MGKWREKFANASARKPSGPLGHFFNQDPGIRSLSFQYIIQKLELTSEDVFLEIGCGTGVLLKMALRIVQAAAGIDPSASMIESARERNLEAVRKGRLDVRMIDANSEPWPWPDETFTCAASNNVFMYIEHPYRVLSEIYRVLKSGGRLVVVTDSDNLANRAISKLFGFSFRLYKDAEMESMLYRAGFREVEVKSNWSGHQKCYGRKL